MKRITTLSLILLIAILLPAFPVQAEQTTGFKPPQLGAPVTRSGRGTRSTPLGHLPTNQIQLLAAKQTGLSSLASPTLYWYVSSVPAYSIEITVQNDNKALLKKNIGTIKTTGIQTIKLADYGVILADEQNYTWSVAFITEPEQHAANLLASATIRYQKPATPLMDVAQMTAAGYWYDAVTRLVETKSPQLQEFLRQEGINISP